MATSMILGANGKRVVIESDGDEAADILRVGRRGDVLGLL